MVTSTIAIIVMQGRGCRLALHVPVDHGAHRLIQALMLVVMGLLLRRSRGRGRGSNSIGLLQVYVVPKAGRSLTADSTQNHCLAS